MIILTHLTIVFRAEQSFVYTSDQRKLIDLLKARKQAKTLLLYRTTIELNLFIYQLKGSILFF